MSKLKKLIMPLVIISTLMVVGCTKEGEKGEAGADGRDGNANVKSITVNNVSWTYSAPNYIADIPYSEITQDIIYNGAVLVYADIGGAYSQVPATFYENSAYSTSIEVVSYTGGVALSWTDSDLTQPSYPTVSTFKIVVIASSAMLANLSIDYTNYEEVKKAYGLGN